LGGTALYLSDAASLARNLGQDLAPSAPSPHCGLDHFGLEVDDVRSAARQLAERGALVRIGPKRLRPGVDVLFVEAPDGVVIEVVSRNRAIDARPDAGTS
jgi:catechol 2,3-dioxygenase-like lactoylglutathione lyase family enzyme